MIKIESINLIGHNKYNFRRQTAEIFSALQNNNEYPELIFYQKINRWFNVL